MTALSDLSDDTAKRNNAGTTDADLKGTWAAQRKAQFFIGLIAAESATGFHAPGEEFRILTVALDEIRKGLLALRGVTAKTRAGKQGHTGIG